MTVAEYNKNPKPPHPEIQPIFVLKNRPSTKSI